MGTPTFAVPILKSLYQNGYPISHIYTQPPQRSLRGQKINKSPIQGIAETLSIELRTPQSLKDNIDEYNFFKMINADLAIVVAYGQIIPREFLNLTKKGFINIHPSILPKWRGAAPIQRSIMNLDKQTGVSIMKISEKLDAGPVCNIYKMELKDSFNTKDVSEKLALIASEKVLENIDDVLADKDWQSIQLPHTWNSTDVLDTQPGYRRSGSWYKKNLKLSSKKSGSIYQLYFEGVNISSTIYLNGVKVGGHIGGYIGFTIDVTNNIKQGNNELCTKVVTDVLSLLPFI